MGREERLIILSMPMADISRHRLFKMRQGEAMEKRNFIIPEFGPLAGLRVIGAGSLIAMPFAATMMADFGA